MAVPLMELDGRIPGHLAILVNRPMPYDPQGIALFRIFAARAATELQRVRAERKRMGRPASEIPVLRVTFRPAAVSSYYEEKPIESNHESFRCRSRDCKPWRQSARL